MFFVAIINNGKLVCIGSSLFLRSRYGNGYYLTLVVDDGSNDVMKSLEHISEDDKDDIVDGSVDDLDTVPTRNASGK